MKSGSIAGVRPRGLRVKTCIKPVGHPTPSPCHVWLGIHLLLLLKARKLKIRKGLQTYEDDDLSGRCAYEKVKILVP